VEIAMRFRITGLDPAPFKTLYGLPDPELARLGVRRYLADRSPGFPDRVELRDAAPGESLLLLNYVHQPARNAYRGSHAIFVREGAQQRYDRIDEIPELLRSRPLSLRAFDAEDMLVDARLLPGTELEEHIDGFLSDPRVEYVHIHYATRGCYAARIDRA